MFRVNDTALAKIRLFSKEADNNFYDCVTAYAGTGEDIQLKNKLKQALADIERWLKAIDKEREKPFEKDRIEYLRKAKIEAKLSIKELWLRDKVLWIWDAQESCRSYMYYDKDIAKKIKDYQKKNILSDPEHKYHVERNKGAIELAKQIMGELSLVKLKKLLTPREYEWFLPLYVEFKHAGGFTIIRDNSR